MDTTADCYLYAGVHMIGALKASLWITSFGLVADIVGAVLLLWWGPILRYQRARRGDPAADPSMQDDAVDATWGLVWLIGGFACQVLGAWLSAFGR
jgi:hypothetical protein